MGGQGPQGPQGRQGVQGWQGWQGFQGGQASGTAPDVQVFTATGAGTWTKPAGSPVTSEVWNIAGGGGGGGCLDGFLSGKGGDGADGIIVVITRY